VPGICGQSQYYLGRFATALNQYLYSFDSWCEDGDGDEDNNENDKGRNE